MRQYLKWCILVANADLKNSSDVQSLIEEAIADNLFSPDMDVLKWQIEEEGPSLQQNVKAFAETMTRKIAFIVEMQKEHSFQQLVVDKSEAHLYKEQFTGTVRFNLRHAFEITEDEQEAERQRLKILAIKLRQPEGWAERQLTRWMDEKRRVPGVIEDLPLNDLVERFYQNVADYMKGKKRGFKNLPFRICALDSGKHKCQKPFFGRLKDQKYCCQLHSQIGHAKAAYRNKPKDYSRKED